MVSVVGPNVLRNGSIRTEVGPKMIIDCDTCTVRGDACSDCVVAVFLGAPSGLDTAEQQAIEVLAASGLVPPLRLATAPDVSDDTPGRSTQAV